MTYMYINILAYYLQEQVNSNMNLIAQYVYINILYITVSFADYSPPFLCWNNA